MFSLEEGGLRDLVHRWHKSFCLTVCLGHNGLVLGCLMAKHPWSLYDVRCKGRATVLYYVIRYTIRAKKLF